MNSTQQSGGVEATLRDFWASRPVRPRRGGKIAGVSAAIGERYGVDPILIRVAFVVGAFYSGAGITLYLLGWLLFPREAEPRPEDTAPRTEPAPTWLALVLILLLLPGVFWLTDSLAILAVAAGLAALYGLHVTRGDRPQAPTAAAPPVEAPTGPIAAEPPSENTWVYPGPEARREPPSWDPLGAVPQAWDLPEPPPQDEPEPPGRRYRWYNPLAVLLTLAFGLLAAGAFTPSTALAGMLGLAGLFLIGGAFLRVGRWPILLAVPLAALAMFFAVFSTYPQQATDLSMGDLRASPQSAEELQRNYGRAAGIVDLDLAELPVAEDQTLRTAVDVGTGQIQVRVPPEVDVWSVCRADVGEVDCLGATADGQGVTRTRMDEGADGPGGGRLELHLTAGAGRVEVIRG
ncbi:PspC domain-containing protein [Saccharopolyspora griseoalba]|uniref:PspC domain-containing protein n=1 Tax=Saccharopolyspora griseoalba TaxID=1431848 RepID=A0ABW2LJW4_9PSEU